MLQTNKFFLSIIVVIILFGVAWADVYTWEDENGVVHYSDTQPATDADWDDTEEAASTEATQERNEPGRPEFDREAITELLKKLEDVSGENDESPAPTVELYVTSWCPYCHKAKSFFRSKGIDFSEYNIEKDAEAAQRMLSLTNSRAVPFAVINGHRIQGFSVSAYERALKY